MIHSARVVIAGYRAYLVSSMQYRVQEGMAMLGLLIESLIYLVVWSTVSVAEGGEVAGYTTGEIQAYFIAWIFVRNVTTGWSPWAMEWQIRRGDFNSLLLRPIHPIFSATADMLASKTGALFTVIPMMVILAVVFDPTFDLVPWSLVAMLPAFLLAFLLRYTLMYTLALSAFWTTRLSAAFDLWFALELFFSGRIAPLDFLPEWGQTIAFYLPFQWMFYFPLELLLGRLTQPEALRGLAIQLVWLVVTVVLVRVIWRGAVRQYSAVGG